MRGNMAAERARLGASAELIGEQVGVSGEQIRRWERGEQEPSASKIIKLAHIYKCTPDYLMGLTDDKLGEEIYQGE